MVYEYPDPVAIGRTRVHAPPSASAVVQSVGSVWKSPGKPAPCPQATQEVVDGHSIPDTR